MAELVTQFEKALESIEPSEDDKENAPVAHEDVRDALSDDATLTEWGIETVLIGSYKRHVSIRRVKDVDVLSKLRNLPEGTSADEVLDAVKRVLLTKYPKERVGSPTAAHLASYNATAPIEASSGDRGGIGSTQEGTANSSTPSTSPPSPNSDTR